ncbi:MAG: HEAT repeat domain-containing protein [Actinomycetota bacterium]|nr:HEAT repeat domain-containing protein [Actinomycetota bacterium]
MLAVLLLVVPSLRLAAQQMPPIGIIDVYGLRTLSESSVRGALGIREGDPVPDSAGPATRRLRGLPGVADARLKLVCCSSDGKPILFVGVAELGAPVNALQPAPTGSVRLPDDVVQLGRAFDDTLMAAVRQGQAAEHDSAGHAFFDYPAANAIQHRYLAIAAHLPMLRDVLKHSASAEHRALAAELLGYATNVADAVPDLENAIHDHDEAVRNNAMRALAVIALYAQQSPLLGIDVSATPFVEMLNSLVWTDRNKASFALFQLTAHRDPALLALLRVQALPALVDIARWRSVGHAYAGYMILGRIEGMPDDALEQAWQHGDRSAVLDSAARMLSAPQPGAARHHLSVLAPDTGSCTTFVDTSP